MAIALDKTYVIFTLYLHDLRGDQWRTEGGWGFNPPGNSEGPSKSCQTQPDCENC